MATFKEFANAEKFNEWLVQQKVTRTIKYLQVHHMDLPSYTTWKNTDCKLWGEKNAPLNRTQSLNDYGKQTWGSGASDGHGHYIAQHFNVFPNGTITTGRDLNSTPIGIRGWNTNAICIEIYGCFDKGHDTMTEAQKKAVAGIYYYLAKKFDISIDNAHIRPHCWFTAGGTYLGCYNSSRSAKTCPGTNFWGHGCKTKADFQHFIDDVKKYKADEFKPYVVKIIVDDLNVRKGAGVSYDKVSEVHKGEAFTIIEVKNGWGKLKSGLGWICISNKYVEKI